MAGGAAGRSHPALGPAKRAFDIAASAMLLVLLSPVLAATALAVLIALGRPVFFRQRRPGLGGRPFNILKFRTMTQARGERGELLPDGARLGRVGQFLRATSLDELPELLNVLRGEMSLVGPRPLLMEYLPLYSADQARRHEVRPGLTGLAQVRGRNALGWNDRFALDLHYVDHWSPGLDLRILWMTLVTAARREGISQEGHATMPPFTGQPTDSPRGDD